MIRNALLASAIALTAFGSAQAQTTGPRLIGGGPDAYVAYDAPSQNVAGGGIASLTGSANSRSVTYVPGTTITEAPTGMVAEVVGGGVERQLVYRPLRAQDRQIAGQGARQGG